MNIEEEISQINIDNSLNIINNKLRLTNKEIRILNQHSIDYKNCIDTKELLYIIDNYINEESYDNDIDLEELDYVASEIAERSYYIDSYK